MVKENCVANMICLEQRCHCFQNYTSINGICRTYPNTLHRSSKENGFLRSSETIKFDLFTQCGMLVWLLYQFTMPMCTRLRARGR